MTDNGAEGGSLNALHEEIEIYLKRFDQADYVQMHDFTRYDLNNLATSMFDLEEGTQYQVMIRTVDDTEHVFDFTTKEEFNLPSAYDVTINVTNNIQLQNAIDSRLMLKLFKA